MHTIRVIYRKISTSLCFCFRFVTSTILHFYRHLEEWIECDWSFYATKQKKLPIKLVFINQFPCILGFVILMFYWKFRFMIHILFLVFNHCFILNMKKINGLLKRLKLHLLHSFGISMNKSIEHMLCIRMPKMIASYVYKCKAIRKVVPFSKEPIWILLTKCDNFCLIKILGERFEQQCKIGPLGKLTLLRNWTFN